MSDDEICLTGVRTATEYPQSLRRIVAKVSVNGKLRQMVFITNNKTWAASTIAELYKARWAVELLFKELKQTLQLQTFYGENENAVKWQIWTAMLVHLLIRFIKHVSKWKASFSRLVGIVRSAIWMKIDLLSAFRFYGTAPPTESTIQQLQVPYLPGFLKQYLKAMGQQVL